MTGPAPRPHRVADVELSLPGSFALADRTEETRALLNIPGAKTDGIRCRFEDGAGRSVTVQHWSDGVPHPGEPLIVLRSWETEREGLRIRVVREAGPPEGPGRVHAFLETGGGHCRVTAEGLDDGAFDAVLDSIRPAPAD